MTRPLRFLLVNAVEWGEEHLKQGYCCDVGEWLKDAVGGDRSRFTVWRVQKEEDAPDIDFDAVIIGGSPASAYETHAWIDRLSDKIRGWRDGGVPMLGICFGHQVIAQALGGKVEKNPKGWEVGTCSVALNNKGIYDPLFKSLPPSFMVMQSHQDIVTQLPEGAERLASSPLCENQSFGIGDRIRTIQFHPEYTVPHMKFIVGPRRERLGKAGIDVDQTLSGLTPTPDSESIMQNFEAMVQKTIS